jgi:hypothetical protein
VLAQLTAIATTPRRIERVRRPGRKVRPLCSRARLILKKLPSFRTTSRVETRMLEGKIDSIERRIARAYENRATVAVVRERAGFYARSIGFIAYAAATPADVNS